MFSCEYCGVFKITCFEEYLRTAASIRCYFDTINLKQSGFCTTYSFKILVSERKRTKIISKIVNHKKKKKLKFSYTVYNIYVMFYYEIPWFYQDFKSENLCFLNLYSVHAAGILDLPNEERNTFSTLRIFRSCRNRYNVSTF